ncbi:fimbrial biogenesis outer membrane usher protein [Cronobacter sakazakii]|uniref:fimbria/pilus outer membrane usher protein n=3 Tax=Cronobacter sakazakii TaxID=28141 RepID=UPI00029BF0A9|nr:fimbria/pilus outer membrane usher protein [Cronobacter sakazakii]MDK1224027.1 fimbria/pilus outer membrane usher protein [Cronobacter turicensis]CCK01538.1 Putative outer membrane fimbrial usher porin precursor [Cronobacter sakazakii 701]EGT0041288.1 fimbrial biogenesis outer membrane usher protein [Cronobacter sakazakii]EGT4240803.1 fimbrial biogenesis outer membrane usher protein [Cronobacter sakazakii]EGT4260391.1 fimbrial biogenesis outer membrane usher protein [Cronobacter sakazakii]
MIKIHFKKARFLPALQGIAFSVNSFISVSVTAFSVLVVFNVAARDNNTVSAKDSVDFNQAFIHGQKFDISRYADGNPVTPGVYNVTLIINGQNHGQHDIRFEQYAAEKNARPCLLLKQLQEAGIRLEIPLSEKQLSDERCYRFDELIPKGQVNYNPADFELTLDIPQINLIPQPRGYIDPSRWDAGSTVGFLDYSGNFYSLFQNNRGEDGDSFQGNLGLLTGLNFAGWRLRKRINSDWSNDKSLRTQNLAGYAQTDITPLKSQMTLGDSNTSGDLFDSYNIRGAQLESDERMLPESLRNYTPIVRGVADTNARVKITQRGQTIYETVVPPGAFEITDIGAMGYGGDLEMTITEADGRQRIQNIPFSAPPMLLHKSISRFAISAGKLKDDAVHNEPTIFQSVYHYGLTSNYTVYTGFQISGHYYSMAVGHAVNTPIGGISMDITHAKSDLADSKESSGNSFRIGLTKYVSPTDTNLTLAAYRYSSKGFYSFREASIARYGDDNNYYASDYRTRQRLTANISQSLWSGSFINFSASIYRYWNNRAASKQYSVSWTQAQRYFSWTLSAMRTRDEDDNYDDTYMVTINVPLGQGGNEKPLFNSLYSTMSNNDSGDTLWQVNATGSQGQQNEINYGVGTTMNKNDDMPSEEQLRGNISYDSPVGQFSATASMNNRSARQLSATANGSLVAHKGGITAGPTIGDYPFAIVGVPGAEGARVYNGHGAKVDGAGYAIVPSLTPYQENIVAIDYSGLPDTVDVLENQKTVVPRMGSAITVDMKTLVGRPIILIVRDVSGEFLPIGAQIIDDKNTSQSIIGQGGMAFVRGWDPEQQHLYVEWDKNKCLIKTNSAKQYAQDMPAGKIVQMEVSCIPQ